MTGEPFTSILCGAFIQVVPVLLVQWQGERKCVDFFLSRSCIGLLTWCMSSVKRGFVALRQIVALNAHLHNSICVCDFPFGKLWAFNLTSQASLDTERERERGRECNHHKPNDTVAHCGCALMAKLHAHTCQSTQAGVKLILMSSCTVLTPEHCTVRGTRHRVALCWATLKMCKTAFPPVGSVTNLLNAGSHLDGDHSA